MRPAVPRAVRPTLLVAIALLLAAMTALSLYTFALLNKEVVPALEDNARVIGDVVGERVERAVELGIPLRRLVGVEDFLDRIRVDSPGVAALAIADTDGNTLYAAGMEPDKMAAIMASADAWAATAEAQTGLLNWLSAQVGQLQHILLLGEVHSGHVVDVVTLPLQHGNRTIGALYVGIDRLYITRQLEQAAFDIAVVIGVALLLAFEALLLVISTTISGPLTQIAQIAAYMARRDFTHEATVLGTALVRRTLQAANDAVHRVNEAAAEVRGRLDATGARLPALEKRLAEAGRFAVGEPVRALSGAQLVGARGAAFLFVLAEELSRPFLPLYIRGFTTSGEGVHQAIQIAVPLSAFMLFMAISGPIASAWSDRIGRRRTFLLGAGLSTAGLAGTALAIGFADLVLWRSLSGVGYALTFVACQGHVLDQTTESDRTRGLSVFVGGILAADICGPAIGGILAEWIGYSGTLVAAAGVALAAGGLAIKLMEDRAHPEGLQHGAMASLAGLRACSRNLRLVSVMLLAAVPAKMMLSGFLFYLAPLILADLGADDSEIGRMAMIYGISALCLMPVFANVCDRLRGHGFMVGTGAILAGCGLVPLVFGATTWSIALAILALGVGQAMSIPAQTAMVTIVGRQEVAAHGPGPVLGTFRLVERMGAAAGPLIAAQLAQHHGFVDTATAFGFASVVTGVLFAALFLSIGTEREPQPLETVPAAEAPR